MLGKSVWYNYVLQKQITAIQSQILDAQQQNKDFQNLIVYYKSDSFREVQARAKLGLKKPGETVVVVPVKNVTDYNSEQTVAQQNISSPEKTQANSNYKLWWQYLAR